VKIIRRLAPMIVEEYDVNLFGEIFSADLGRSSN